MGSMRTIGLIHGMGSPSTADFYVGVNDRVNARLGGASRAEMLISSIDFSLVDAAVAAGDWDGLTELLVARGLALESAGADFLVIGSNTGHIAADAIREAAGIPLLHIADSIGTAADSLGAHRLAVLGTKPTMEESFYVEPLRERGFDVFIPDVDDREFLNRIVFEELTLGVFRDDTRARFLDVVDRMAGQGADSVVLGCTEFGLLVGDAYKGTVPLIDSEQAHIDATVEAALAD